MSDSPKKLPFIAELIPIFKGIPANYEGKLMKFLGSTKIPLSIHLRWSPNKSGRSFEMPFIPQQQSEYPSDAHCVLQVWELDKWQSNASEDDIVEDDISAKDTENELLGEIQGFIKRINKKKFIFLTDQVPDVPLIQSNQTNEQITIKIPILQPNGIIDYNGSNWVLNVTGEIETHLEIGISIRSPSIALNLKEEVFPFPVVHLHTQNIKISEPPSTDEIYHVWEEKWKRWDKQELSPDCGWACRMVLLTMGGKRFTKPVYLRTKNKDWWSCTKQDGVNALRRMEHDDIDKIESDICYIYSREPDNDPEEVNLIPGMTIYFVEGCRQGPCGHQNCVICKELTGDGWRWHDPHMVMYAGNNKILDYLDPRGLKTLGPVYHHTRSRRYNSPNLTNLTFDRIVVLRIRDPFEHMR